MGVPVRLGAPGVSDDPAWSDRPWFDHVGIAVHELARAADLIHRGLGGEFLRGGDNSEYGFRTAQFKLRGGIKLELLAPLAEYPNTALTRFLDQRGPGVHHLTLMSEDVAGLDEHLRNCGFLTVDSDFSEPNWRETYLGPGQGLGTIIQMGDSVVDWLHPEPGATFEDVAEGSWYWSRGRTVRRPEAR